MTTNLSQHIKSATIQIDGMTRSFKVLSMSITHIIDPHKHERCSAETTEAFVEKVLQSVTPPC